MAVKPIPKGYHTVTPYLTVRDAPKVIEFLKQAFGAKLSHEMKRPDGSIMHAEMRIGNSMLMLGEAPNEFGPMPTSIYLYVTDSDAAYERALQAGGISIFAIMTLPSGERYGGVKDPCGNIWWIATHIEDVPPEEEERRWREFRMP